MRYIFAALIFLHGAIHLMGFLKAYNLARIEQLTTQIGRFPGAIWLLVSILFIVAGLGYLFRAEYWYWFAFLAIALSTYLVITAWSDAKFGTIANIVILAVSITSYGTTTFQRKFERDVLAGLSRQVSPPESILTEEDIESLPDPVQRYIRNSGSIGKPVVNNFRLEFTGRIRQDDGSEWMPFTTVQYNFIEDASRYFFMKAEMKRLPVAGYHCFKQGEAYMDIRLFSLFRVQYQTGPEMGISETVTFFNDMCCMAPASLIDERISWLEVDGNNVKASFSLNDITISAWLCFDENGKLLNFVSDNRYAYDSEKGMQQYQWSTPLADYREVDGVNLYTSAEAVYRYPEGDFCYGTFTLTHVEYNSRRLY